MKAIANRVPIGPSDCNRGMYVWPSTVGPKANERRSKGRAAPKLCKRPQVWASGQGSGSLGGRMFLAHKGSCDALRKRKTHVCHPFRKIEVKNNLARFHLESTCFEPTYMMLCVVLVTVIASMLYYDEVF